MIILDFNRYFVQIEIRIPFLNVASLPFDKKKILKQIEILWFVYHKKMALLHLIDTRFDQQIFKNQ